MSAKSVVTTWPDAVAACAFLLLALEAVVTVQALRDASGAVGPRIDEEDAEPLLAVTRLDTARCRAACLLQFTTVRAPGHFRDCEDSSECSMCWRTCRLIMADFLVWGPMCQVEDICYPGCQAACAFHNKSKAWPATESGRPPSGAFRASPRIDVVQSDFLVTWTRPRAVDYSNEEPPLVYTLAARQPRKGEAWGEVDQTQRCKASVSQWRLLDTSELRVIAVSPRGVWAVSAAVRVPTLAAVDEVTDEAEEPLLSDAAAAPRVLLPWPAPQLVNLRLSTHLGLEAHIAWQTILDHDTKVDHKFEVTWRLLDAAMELTGRLYTLETEAAFPVLPASSYSIFVRRLDLEGKPTGTSGSLTLDTAEADTETSLLLPRMTGRCVRVEGIAACMASISILAVAAVACLICRKSRRSWRLQTRSKKLSSPQFKDIRRTAGCVPENNGGHERNCGHSTGCNRKNSFPSSGLPKEAGSPDDGTYFVFDLRSS
ncbi:uncharacterized protein LOC144132301 isoform X3 [Amblyomma americanum]